MKNVFLNRLILFKKASNSDCFQGIIYNKIIETISKVNYLEEDLQRKREGKGIRGRL